MEKHLAEIFIRHGGSFQVFLANLATLTGYGFDLPKLSSRLCFASTEMASYRVLAMSHVSHKRCPRTFDFMDCDYTR